MGHRVKYPRTPHLPWSPGATSDDKVMSEKGLDALAAAPLVVTEKMDGGNVTLMRDAFYARSATSGTPPWETRAKAEWARVAHDIPTDWRVSAESLWARRSLRYADLEAPLLVFGVWTGDTLLSWEDTVEWSSLLGLHTVPVLGFPESARHALGLWSARRDAESSEGFVVRDSREFPSGEFPMRVAKWVRANHVRTSAAWRRAALDANGFATGRNSMADEEPR